MLWRVVRTLNAHPAISMISISIEDEDALTSVPELAALMRAGRLRRLATGDSPAASLALAIDAIGDGAPLLITTGDHPLLTSEMIDAFLSGAPDNCDFAIAVAPAEIVSSAYPGAIRTYYRLAGRGFSGCNLFLARTAKAAEVARYWRRMEAFRKRPLRLIMAAGPFALLRAVLGLIDLDGLCALLSARIGATITPVLLPYAEAAIDVDKPEDLRLVEAIISKREAAA
jgi:CTP:molybdopterin cytidylyltransferase MocA